jgi:hypothetical protein
MQEPDEAIAKVDISNIVRRYNKMKYSDMMLKPLMDTPIFY